MSKEKKETQMSLWEGSPANQCQLQEKEEEQMMTAISGQKCLDSLGRSNPNSLLGRMCKELLTSKTAWYSDRCKTTWKVKVSKSNVSLFQLQASVLGTRGTESGLWATPNTMDHLPPRSKEGTLKLQQGHRKGRTRPANLREQVDPETMKMWRTPDAASGGSNLPGIQKALDQGHMKRPSGHAIHLRLEDQVREPRLWPTPVQDDVHHRKQKYQQGGTALSTKAGGTLNPTWVEWLMGYPAEYTDLKHWETLLSHKSLKKLVKQ